MMLTAVFVSQPSVGLTAPLPQYHSAAAADGLTGQVSPVLSPQALPLITTSPSPVCQMSNSSLCDIIRDKTYYHTINVYQP